MTSEWRTEPLQCVVSYIAKGIPPAYVEAEGENTVRVLNQKCNRDFAISYAESRLHDLSERCVPQEKYLRNEDILINSTGTGTAGRIAQLNIVPCPTIVDGHMIVLRGNEKVRPRYLGYALKAQQATVLQLDEGSTGQTELNRDRLLSDIEVSYPVSLEEQDTIAATLSALDARIAENRKINHHLEQIVQAIYKSWFVDFEPFGGVMPDDWYPCTIGDISSEINARLSEENNLVVLSAVKTGELVPSDDYFTKQVYSKALARYKAVEPNDFAYNPMRINIGSIGVNELGKTCCVSPDYMVFRANKGFHHFLRLVIKSPYFLEAVNTFVSGSVRQRVYYKQLKMVEAIYPDNDTLTEFNQVCDAFIAKANEVKRENVNLADLRDTLLPRLMTGELSIIDSAVAK